MKESRTEAERAAAVRAAWAALEEDESAIYFERRCWECGKRWTPTDEEIAACQQDQDVQYPPHGAYGAGRPCSPREASNVIVVCGDCLGGIDAYLADIEKRRREAEEMGLL
jgi:hypothetical protein